MFVRDYMTSSVTTLNDDARLIDAALLIRRTGKRHVPILSSDGGKVVGIISDRDVARMAPSILGQMTPEEYNRIFEATPITVAMTKNPLTIGPDEPISKAVEQLYSKKIGALLVVKEGNLEGILTVSDMLGLLNELLAEKGNAAGAALD